MKLDFKRMHYGTESLAGQWTCKDSDLNLSLTIVYTQKSWDLMGLDILRVRTGPTIK